MVLMNKFGNASERTLQLLPQSVDRQMPPPCEPAYTPFGSTGSTAIVSKRPVDGARPGTWPFVIGRGPSSIQGLSAWNTPKTTPPTELPPVKTISSGSGVVWNQR